MNFGILKNMVENLVQWYKCPFCSGRDISEQHIDIIGAAGNTVNIDMHCPSCKKHFMAKTEVIHMDIGNISADKMWKIQKSLAAIKWKLWWNIEIEIEKVQSKKKQIRDESIVDLQKWMQSDGLTVEDLFGESQE